MKTPEDMTMEGIREQLAMYNRLYYDTRRQEEGYMQKNRDSALKRIEMKTLMKTEECCFNFKSKIKPTFLYCSY